MKLIVKKIDGMKFYLRPETSDLKTVEEVISNKAYERNGMEILAGENWVDFGANIGAFSVMACARGAKVKSYEPDPYSFELLKRNLALNNFKAEIHNAAVVAHRRGRDYLNISKTQQYWRNSIERSLGGNVIEIKTEFFADVIDRGCCIKMDIEGTEMPILEKLEYGMKKLVFEWSFDVDPDIERYRKIVDRMKTLFPNVKATVINPEHKIWQKSWFPPCRNVYCWQ